MEPRFEESLIEFGENKRVFYFLGKQFKLTLEGLWELDQGRGDWAVFLSYRLKKRAEKVLEQEEKSRSFLYGEKVLGQEEKSRSFLYGADSVQDAEFQGETYIFKNKLPSEMDLALEKIFADLIERSDRIMNF